MQVVLIMFRNGGGERRSFPVVRDLTTIGRREDCDLRIPVGDVSRKHCRLVRSDDNLRIQDLGSSNGTFVNGQQVQDAFLNPGDTVSVGPVNFVVQIDGVPAEGDLSAPSAANDTAAGGTALALAALTAGAASSDAAEIGDVAAVGDLLEPLPEAAGAGDGDDDLFADDDAMGGSVAEPIDLSEPAAEPTARPAGTSDLTVDELPSELAQDVAFDQVEMDDVDVEASAPMPPETPSATAPADDDWDFLVEEGEGNPGDADLKLDLDTPPGH